MWLCGPFRHIASTSDCGQIAACAGANRTLSVGRSWLPPHSRCWRCRDSSPAIGHRAAMRRLRLPPTGDTGWHSGIVLRQNEVLPGRRLNFRRATKVLGCGTRWDKAGRMRDKPLWLLWFLRGAAACPPAAAAHRQVPLATPQACRLARRYAPDRRQRDRRTEARLAREPVSVVRVWAAPFGAVVLSSGPARMRPQHEHDDREYALSACCRRTGAALCSGSYVCGRRHAVDHRL